MKNPPKFKNHFFSQVQIVFLCVAASHLLFFLLIFFNHPNTNLQNKVAQLKSPTLKMEMEDVLVENSFEEQSAESLKKEENNSKIKKETNIVKQNFTNKKPVFKKNSTASDLQPAIFSASYLNNTSPDYPSLSRRLGEQGTVILNVFVNSDGRAEKIKIKQTSGFDRLDSAAIETVKKWKFIPAKNNGTSVESWAQVPIDFILEK